MSKLLLDSQPLLVIPELAAKIGLNECIVLQQIHYWNEINKKANNNYRDGHYWTFNSIVQWQDQFPFWSKNTIQRTFTNLEKMKLVITGNYNKLKIDRTKWYRIDYKVLQALEESPFTQIGVTNISEWCNHLSSLGLPLPEINSEINPKIKRNIYIISNENDVFSYYSQKYKEKFGKDHPTMNEEKIDELRSNYYNLSSDLDIDQEQWIEAVDYHFEHLSPKNNGNILAFLGRNGGHSPVYRYLEDLAAEEEDYWEAL
jgi:hypothetical protein